MFNSFHFIYIEKPSLISLKPLITSLMGCYNRPPPFFSFHFRSRPLLSHQTLRFPTYHIQPIFHPIFQIILQQTKQIPASGSYYAYATFAVNLQNVSYCRPLNDVSQWLETLKKRENVLLNCSCLFCWLVCSFFD